MSRQNISLGRILGIRIGLDYSWFLVFALLTWLLAQGYYPVEFKNWPSLLYWFMGVLTAIMLFVSVLLHELGHSLVALRYEMPVRSITLFIFGGVAQIGAEPAQSHRRVSHRNRRSSRKLDAGSLFLRGAAAG